MNISQVDQSNFIVLSQQSDVVVAAPDSFLNVTFGLLDVVFKLRYLNIIHVDPRKILFDFLPRKDFTSRFVKRRSARSPQRKPSRSCMFWTSFRVL